MMDYRQKYIKYKLKYLTLRGGGYKELASEIEITNQHLNELGVKDRLSALIKGVEILLAKPSWTGVVNRSKQPNWYKDNAEFSSISKNTEYLNLFLQDMINAKNTNNHAYDTAAADNAASTKAATDNATSAKAASDKAASDKAASDKAAADKAAAAKLASDKAASDKAASDKAASDKAASDKAASDKAASDKAASDKAASSTAFTSTSPKVKGYGPKLETGTGDKESKKYCFSGLENRINNNNIKDYLEFYKKSCNDKGVIVDNEVYKKMYEEAIADKKESSGIDDKQLENELEIFSKRINKHKENMEFYKKQLDEFNTKMEKSKQKNDTYMIEYYSFMPDLYDKVLLVANKELLYDKTAYDLVKNRIDPKIASKTLDPIKVEIKNARVAFQQGQFDFARKMKQQSKPYSHNQSNGIETYDWTNNYI